jgi:hypothetical protein
VHDQKQVGDRLTLSVSSTIVGMKNRFLAGAEFIDIDFERSRGFRRNVPLAAGGSVDSYNPILGLYGPMELPGNRKCLSLWAVQQRN